MRVALITFVVFVSVMSFLVDAKAYNAGGGIALSLNEGEVWDMPDPSEDIDNFWDAFNNALSNNQVLIAYSPQASNDIYDYVAITFSNSYIKDVIGDLFYEDIHGSTTNTSDSVLTFSYYSDIDRTQLLFNVTISQNDEGSYDVAITTVDGTVVAPDIAVMTITEFMEAYSGQSMAEAVSTEVSRIASRQTVHLVSTRVLNIFSPRPSKSGGSQQANLEGNPFNVGYFEQTTGLAAGDETSKWGVWGMGAYSKFRNTETVYNMDGDVGVFLAGIDRLFFNERLALGLAVGYESSSIDFDDLGTDLTGQGFSLTPYLAFRFTDSLLLKGTFSATSLSYDADDVDDYDSTRLMSDIALEYSWIRNSWMLSGEVGYMYLDEDLDEEDGEDVYLGELRVSGAIGYALTDSFVPFIKATYHNDLVSSGDDSLDEDDLEAAIGLNYYRNSWIFSLQFSTMLLRDNQELYGGSLMVRYEF